MSAEQRDEILAKLDELHTVCLAGQAGYQKAATELPREPQLQAYLERMGEERRSFADDLEALMFRYGKSSRHGLGVRADVHRLWIDVRAALEHHSPASMIAECERGERAALTRYESALRMPLSLEVEELLIDQCASIREAWASLDQMRHPD
jgi:uncharacterized protein (TIGR02284 family)